MRLLTPRLNPSPRRNPVNFVVFHADHGVKPEQMEFIKNKLVQEAPQGFFIREIELPRELGTVRNAMYGPASGDAPVPESAVSYRPRGDRPWTDRVVTWPTRPVDYVQAIGVREGDDFKLFTVYGGPLAPQNPADPGCRDVPGAQKFWSEHALSLEQWEPKKNPAKKKKFTVAEQWGTTRMTDAELVEIINWPFEPTLDWNAQQHRLAHAEACREELARRQARSTRTNPRFNAGRVASGESIAAVYADLDRKIEAVLRGHPALDFLQDSDREAFDEGLLSGGEVVELLNKHYRGHPDVTEARAFQMTPAYRKSLRIGKKGGF